jgi:hypothetical protein
MPRGVKNGEPLAVFNSILVGDPTEKVMIDLLYIADNSRGVEIFEVVGMVNRAEKQHSSHCRLAGFFLMEYIRNRVFVVKTRSAQQVGEGALSCWSKFRDLLTPSRYRQLPENSRSNKVNKPRKLRRNHRPAKECVRLSGDKKICPPVDKQDPIVCAIMNEEDMSDPLTA